MPTIRDLVQDWQQPDSPTLHDVATTSPEPAVTEEHPGWSARMPGDEDHPLRVGVSNPMPEVGGPLALSRALREGQIPFDKERQVRVYLDQFQKQSGQSLYNPKNHRVLDEPQEPRVYGDSTYLSTRR